MKYTFAETGTGFELSVDGKLIIRHSKDEPSLFLGQGKESIHMFRGNFDISDETLKNFAPTVSKIEQDGNKTAVSFVSPEMEGVYTLSFFQDGELLRISGSADDKSINRLALHLYAEEKEHVTGGGEQYSYLDLRGRNYPIWTREQGVGRNKNTELTKLADADDGGGGDYHTTYWPQPTFLSSRGYFAHLDNFEYSELDFRNAGYHNLILWSSELSMVVGAGENYYQLCSLLTGYLGRQIELPDWALDGLWLGVQGGTEVVQGLLNKCREGGINTPVVWIQDWEGKRVTSFGKRLQWDWRWNEELYPGLDEIIKNEPETRWMAYCNPYLVEGGLLYNEAKEKGYFIKRTDGSDYIYDFGEFNCGVVDLTMPEAFDWYKNVIKKNIIGMGFKGWMADFGEYNPADCVCYGGTGMQVHNMWPMLWAKCNREAVQEAGVEGDCVFFSRSGFTGSQRYSTMLFAGDQTVDWSVDDGLPSVVTAALSLGLSGFGLLAFDIGGYTSLFNVTRSEELIKRGAELACFTPVMRSHEGNRPDRNVQLYSTDELIAFTARLENIHRQLMPYIKRCVEINAKQGIPVQRPLFFAEPEADVAYDRDLFSYMLGEDMIVAPVVTPETDKRELWLPVGEWVHLWTGVEYAPGYHSVEAPCGKPPVFYRKGSEFESLFVTVGKL